MVKRMVTRIASKPRLSVTTRLSPGGIETSAGDMLQTATQVGIAAGRAGTGIGVDATVMMLIWRFSGSRGGSEQVNSAAAKDALARIDSNLRN